LAVAVLGLEPEHAVEFVSPGWLLGFRGMPAPVGPGCNGEVACTPAIGSMLVCATLTPTPAPASAIATARSSLARRPRIETSHARSAVCNAAFKTRSGGDTWY
jgi:hypothetical protein